MKELQPLPSLFLSARLTRFDLVVRDMTEAGFTAETIAKRTGFTEGQVRYRMKLLGISTTKYRRGENELAKKVIECIDENSKRFFDTIVSNVRRYLKD